jgi:hypothetical protein
LTASATFNQGLSAPVTNSGATTADVTLTLNGADSTLATLTSAGTGKKLILAGNGKVTVGGAVVATENLEVTSAGAVSFAVEAQTNTIATGKSLTVGNSSSVKAGQYLTFGPGKYTAGGANGFAYGNNILKALTNADGTLALGDAETGKLTLGGSDDVGNVTFTAATAVTLRGSGTGAIIVSAGGNLTLGTKADLKLGAGTVALGNAGKLTLGNGSIISGFTVAANGGTGLITTAQQGADASFKGTVDSVAYNSGVTPASTGAGYTKPSESGLITGSDTYTITGSADNGGVLTAASKVYQ